MSEVSPEDIIASEADTGDMRLAKLRIKNFRSVRDLAVELPQMCALVGPNNAGKSNILLAVARVLERGYVRVGDFDERDVFGHDAERDVEISLTFDPPIPFKRFAASEPVDIPTLVFKLTRYKRGAQKGERRLEQACVNAKGDPVHVPKEAPKRGQRTPYEPVVGIPTVVRDAVPLVYMRTQRRLRDHLPAARFSFLRQMFEDINRDFNDPTQTGSVGSTGVPRADRFRNLMAEALKLLRTEDFAKLEETINRHALEQLGFDPDKTTELGFEFAPFSTADFYRSLELQFREGDFRIDATELGEGFQNALVLAILQAFEERRKQGAILLIEEPEMFLHPQTQRSLYKTLRSVAERNQVVYATHSPHFVSVPEYREVAIVRRAPQEGTAVSWSTLTADTKRLERLRKDLDPERNEFFFAKRLLLVEGDTEKLALPEYAKRLDIDIDRAGSTIVEVGGKRALLPFAELARSFGIPTAVLYDEDSGDDVPGDDEEQLNRELAAFGTASDDQAAWQLSKDYEANLRSQLGEDRYQQLCRAHPGIRKASRARLIAADGSTVIPGPVEEVLRWLTDA